MPLPKEAKDLLLQIANDKVPSVGPGKVQLGLLHTMIYDAKFKNELPFWDMLPLFFVLARYSDRILGINIHYLPYAYRMNLAERLMTAIKNKNRLNYGDIKSAWQSSKIPIGYAALCIRVYLHSHIRSKIKQFDWDTYKEAVRIFLPKFKKEQEEYIYKIIMQKFYSHAKSSGKKAKWTNKKK